MYLLIKTFSIFVIFCICVPFFTLLLITALFVLNQRGLFDGHVGYLQLCTQCCSEYPWICTVTLHLQAYLLVNFYNKLQMLEWCRQKIGKQQGSPFLQCPSRTSHWLKWTGSQPAWGLGNAVCRALASASQSRAGLERREHG